MKRILLAVLAWVALLIALPFPVDAQTSGEVVLGYRATTVPPCLSASQIPCFVPYGATLPINGGGGSAVASSVAGGEFQPNGNYATPMGVTTTTSNQALPAGASVRITNVGANGAYFNIGNSSVTATSADQFIEAGGVRDLTVGSNTTLAAVTPTGTTTLNMAGGIGQNANLNTASSDLNALVNGAFTTGQKTSINSLSTVMATDAGCTGVAVLSAASNNSQLIGAAGLRTLCAVTWLNTTTSTVDIRLYDSATAPTCSSATGVVANYVVQSNTVSPGGAPPLGPFGQQFVNGIGLCITGANANNDNTNAVTGINVNFTYK